MSDYGPDWGDNKQLLIESYNNSTFSLTTNGLKEPIYDFTLFYTQSPENGNAQVYVNRFKVGDIKGYSPYVLPGGVIKVHNIKNSGQSIEINFVINGKDENSGNYFVGIDGISLVPVKNN